MATHSKTVLYAQVVGAVLTLVGILGLATATGTNGVEQLLGLDVNLLHNLVHLLTGLVGLVVGFKAMQHARMYALVFGVVYLVVAIDGFVGLGIGNALFGHVNQVDNFIHLALGVAGLGAYFADKNQVVVADRV